MFIVDTGRWLTIYRKFSGDEDALARKGAVIDLMEDSATLPTAQSSFVTTILAGGVSTDDDPSV